MKGINNWKNNNLIPKTVLTSLLGQPDDTLHTPSTTWKNQLHGIECSTENVPFALERFSELKHQ